MLRKKAGAWDYRDTMEKRTVHVSVKMTPSDLEQFKAATKILWPGAVITKSSMILGLARLCAEETLNKEKQRRRGSRP